MKKINAMRNLKDTKIISDKRLIKEEDRPLSEEDMEQVLYGIGTNSYNRFSAFYEIKHRLDDKVYWKGLALAYDSSDNLYEYTDEVKECFTSDRPHREELMDKKERMYYDRLPEILILHRAMTKKEYNNGNHGVSWTLRKSVAVFFKDKYKRNQDTDDKEKTIMKKKVNKSQIIAVFLDRNEFEVILTN